MHGVLRARGGGCKQSKPTLDVAAADQTEARCREGGVSRYLGSGL